jgi:hypothetical protein
VCRIADPDAFASLNGGMIRLVARLHVDLLRTSSAVCQPA